MHMNHCQSTHTPPSTTARLALKVKSLQDSLVFGNLEPRSCNDNFFRGLVYSYFVFLRNICKCIYLYIYMCVIVQLTNNNLLLLFKNIVRYAIFSFWFQSQSYLVFYRYTKWCALSCDSYLWLRWCYYIIAIHYFITRYITIRISNYLRTHKI